MGLFNKKNNNKSQKDKLGVFASFILLNDISIDFDLFIKNFYEDWGIEIPINDVSKENEAVVSEIDGMMVTIGYMPAPIPNDEVVENAKTNFMWKEAVAVAESHKAHIIVAVLRREQPLLEAAVLYVKLCASCLKQPHAVAINTIGSVLAPDFYIHTAKSYIENDSFPIMNLVFFGLYSNDNGKTCSGYTYGMDNFGKKDIEILNSLHKAGEILDFMVDIASYVIEYDVILKDGETIGFSAEQKLPITESAGVAINVNTLKIQF